MRGLFMCGVVAVLGASVSNAGELTASKPNVVLIITDDQGYGPLGRHGNTWIRTPHLDDLYDHSVRFERFLVEPTCSPTRSAIMTGRHPFKNGITHTILERERMTLDATILPQVLKAVGYSSGIFGKWHLGDEEPYQPHRRGFDEAFIHGAGGIGQAYDCSCADAPNNSYFDPVIRHNGRFVQTKGFCTDVFFDAAIAWIGKQHAAKQPFFAYIATNAPHAPYFAPPEKSQRFKELGFEDGPAGFYGMVENIDDNIGRLMQSLTDQGMLKNTLVIFMSDNGMAGGGGAKGPGPLGKNPDGSPIISWNDEMKGLKGSPDEGGVRVPFFVRWDGRVGKSRDIATTAAHIDIFPTLAELTGAAIPPGQVEGRSLVPLLESDSAAETWEDRYLFTHVGRWPVGDDPDKHQWQKFSVRSQQFRLVGEALFDMAADPGQTKDVARDNPAVVEAMRGAYETFWREARPLMVNEGAEMSPTRPFWVEYEQQSKAGGIPEWTAQP